MSDEVAMILGEMVILVMSFLMYQAIYKTSIINLLNLKKPSLTILLVLSLLAALAMIIVGAGFIAYVFVNRRRIDIVVHETEPLLIALNGLFLLEMIFQVIIFKIQDGKDKHLKN